MDFTIEIIDGNQLISLAENLGISEKWFTPFHSTGQTEQEDIRVKIWKASQKYYEILCSGNNKLEGSRYLRPFFRMAFIKMFIMSRWLSTGRAGWHQSRKYSRSMEMSTWS